MTHQAMQHSHQIDEHIASVKALSPSGWRLAPGQVISLLPKTSGRLSVRDGLAWITMTGDDPCPATQPGDHFLAASQSLAVRAGCHLVLEATARPGEPVKGLVFEWSESADLHSASDAVARPGWRVQVLEPAKDLLRALGDGAVAFMRLTVGSVGVLGQAFEQVDRDVSPREWSAR